MATTKRLIKSLKDTKNIDILQLLKSFIYDDRQLTLYKEGVIYSKKDIVIKFDSSVNRFITYRCIVPTSSSTWNSTQWQKETAINTIFNMEDKLIIHSMSEPTFTENKIWFNDLQTNGDGTINTLTKVKNSNGTYETLYVASVADNVYMQSDRSQSLTNKIGIMDEERTRIRSLYLMDTLDLLFQLGVLTPNSKTMSFISILDVSSDIDISISGNLSRYNGIINI